MTTKKANKIEKTRFGWLLVDFANSILLVNGGLYFSRWIVDDLGAPSFFYNVTVGIASMLVFILAVPIGKKVDKYGPIRPLIITVAIMCASAIMLSIQTELSIKGELVIAFVSLLFIIILLSYQLSLISHNALLLHEPMSRDIKKNSSYTSVANWLGSLFGIILTAGFVSGAFLGEGGSSSAFMPAALATMILASIGLYLVRGLDGKRNVLNSVEELKNSFSAWHKWSYRIFLIAAFLLLDVIFTVQLNLSQLMSVVHGVGEESIAPLFLMILLGAAVGGAVSALVPVSAHTRLFVSAVLLSSMIVCLTSFEYIESLYAAIFFLSGMLVGLIEPCLREIYAGYFDTSHAGFGFSIYNIVGRASTIIGPVILAILLYVTNDEVYGYQVGFFALAGMALAGGVLGWVAHVVSDESLGGEKTNDSIS